MNTWEDFAELAQQIFAPLVDTFGFRALPPSQPFLYYDSATVRISLFFDSLRHELDIGISRTADIGRQKPSFGLSPLLAIHDIEAWESYKIAFPHGRPALESSLLLMRQHLFKYGSSLLTGDTRDLDAMDRLESEVANRLSTPSGGDNYLSVVREVVRGFHDHAA